MLLLNRVKVYQVAEAVMFWGFIGLLVVYGVVIQHIWIVLRFGRLTA